MNNKSYFQNKKIWVTGASSGIGEQLVYQLNAAGAKLIISSRRKEGLEAVKSRAMIPENISVVVLDQSSETSIKRAFEIVSTEFDSIDILFNNGGISQRSTAMETLPEVERKLFEVNFFGNILLSKLVCAGMIKKQNGQIVITTSLLGKWGFFLRSSLAATKHALHGYYDSMRMEIENQGVLITLVTPGFITTEISKNSMDAYGNAIGSMDNNLAQGLSAEECARRMLVGVAKRKKEFAIGGKEINGLWVKRFFPKMFERILRKKSAQ